MPRIHQYADRYRAEDFIKALDHARVDAGLRTVTDAAEASGVPSTTLWRRWKNPDGLTVGELIQLLRVLPVPVEALLTFLGYTPQQIKQFREEKTA